MPNIDDYETPSDYFAALHKLNQILLDNIKAQLPELTRYVEAINRSDDGVYRFYHQSFKVYKLQRYTERMVSILRDLAPEGTTICNPYFLKIVKAGTGKQWQLSHNDRWLQHTRPIVEAFLHCCWFLNVAVRYGNELEVAPTSLPSGWAALLYLYGLR